MKSADSSYETQNVTKEAISLSSLKQLQLGRGDSFWHKLFWK